MTNGSQINSYQEKFKNFVLGKGPAALSFINNDIAIPTAFDPKMKKKFVESRAGVYRNNVFFSLGEAMGNLYPVCKRIIGNDCFRVVARQYIMKYPPEDPVLAFYGKKFPELISAAESCKHLHYLKDVAQLEWHCQCSLHAADADTFDPASLSAMSEEDLSNLKFSIDPSAKFMVSRFPVDTIWEENLKPKVEVINIDRDDRTYLLVYRKEFQIQVVNLQPTVYHLLVFLDQGKTISDAWEQAQELAAEQALGDGEFSDILGYLLGLAIFVIKK